MKTFTHYGVNVTYQITEKSFKEALRENKIEYIDVPSLLNNIVRYTKNGVKKYALIITPNTADTYYEKIYITPEIPVDMDWGLLTEDVNDQLNGNPPMEMKTKARLYLEEALKIANEFIHKDDKPEDFFQNMYKKPSVTEIKIALSSLGIYLNELKYMDHHDIDEEFFDSLLL